MLCYVMLCYVMLCYVMLCYVMLCYRVFGVGFSFVNVGESDASGAKSKRRPNLDAQLKSEDDCFILCFQEDDVFHFRDITKNRQLL